MIPTDYNPYGLLPVIIISDGDGVEKYRFDSFSDAKDFDLIQWTINGAMNNEHGSATLAIRDDDSNLIDKTTLQRTIKIHGGDMVTIDLGKDAQSLSRWFGGMIEEPAVIRPGFGLQDIIIKAFGWGVYTAHRFATFNHIQKLTADGNAYDADDDNSKASALFKRVLTDKSLLVVKANMPDFDTSLVDDSPVIIQELLKNYETVASILSEIANYADCVYGITPDRKAFMYNRGSKDSGFLVTNDTEVPTRRTRNWNKDKFMLILDGSPSYKDSTLNGAYSHILGLGAQRQIRHEVSLTANAIRSLNDDTMAFLVTGDDVLNIRKIIVGMSRAGDIDAPLIARIVGIADDGTPALDDQRRVIRIESDVINDSLTNTGWLQFILNPTNEAPVSGYYLIIDKYTGNGDLSLEYDVNGAGGFYSYNEQTKTWTQIGGSIKRQVFTSYSINLIGQNTTAIKKFKHLKETVIPMFDLPDEESALTGMEALLNTLSHERRLFEPITCSAPTEMPPMGQTLRVYDIHNGLDVSAIMVGFTITGDADTTENRGATKITVYLEDYHL